MKRLPIGISDFKELINGDYYYVDKTDLIREIWKASAHVLLIPRPRRFGKTLNLSMLRYFFEKTPESNAHLFEGMAIGNDTNLLAQQGQYPVVFLTFKDIKEKTWEQAYKKLCDVIAAEFLRHKKLLNMPFSDQDPEHDRFMRLASGSASYAEYSTSLHFLTKLLQEHYSQKVIVLLDEYDAPIHAAFNENYYSDAIAFLRSLMSSVFKDNSYLERGIITGILRTAKEGIFSGLNNLNVFSLLRTACSDKFGFTQQEVNRFLKDQKLVDLQPVAQQWYNGYQFGQTVIYNPWSILKFAEERGLLAPYWVNTSDNKLIKRLLGLADEGVKEDLELLLQGKSVTKAIDDAITLVGIERNDKALWSLLLFTGYLTYTTQEIKEGIIYCALTIPNKEIQVLYKEFVNEAMQEALTSKKVTLLLAALTSGDAKILSALLQEFIINNMSFYDISEKEPERSYHQFVLGLLVALQDQYQVRSNRESGYGRYDIMLIPHDLTKNGIIIEFKKTFQEETLAAAADNALEQIKNKQYAQELITRGIKNIIVYGIAVQGKKILIKMEA